MQRVPHVTDPATQPLAAPLQVSPFGQQPSESQ
jgi:hypothetical protein